MTNLQKDLAEVVRLLPSIKTSTQAYAECSATCVNFIRTHHAEIARDREDAARYRFLRDDADDDFEVTKWMDNDIQWVMNIADPDAMDQAIDAAMKDSQP